MQHFGSLQPDFNQSKRLQVSQFFYSSSSLPSIRTKKSVQFVPYLQQRDRLGRLLTSDRQNNNENESSISLAQIKLFHQSRNKNQQFQQKETKLNKAVQSFFKKIDIESKQLTRTKLVPKKVVLLVQNILNNKQFQQEYDIGNALDRIKIKRKDCIIKSQNKKFSQQKIPQNMKLSKLNKQNLIQTRGNLIKNNSMLQKKSRNFEASSKSPIKTKDNFKHHRRSESLIGSLKVKLNPQQSDYKRYKQQQQSSLKIFEDYEQGHAKFRQKMKQSKQIAYNIKKQLQLD